MQMLGGYWYGTGRRKTAVARVFIKPGSGNFIVNGRALNEYFKRETLLLNINYPLKLLNVEGRYDIMVNVRGGGESGQADAVKYGLAKALLSEDPGRREVLKRAGLLHRDPRVKERKKYGQPGARKKYQYSKR